MSRRLLVLASTYPARSDDGTPAFVRDLALAESMSFSTVVVVPAVPGAPSTEQIGDLTVIRFRYFFRRWEDLADGAIIENLRSRRSRVLQVVPFVVAEHLAVRRWVRRHQPDVMHVHWIIPQGLAAYPMLRRIPSLITTLGGDLYALNGPFSTAVKRRVVGRAAALSTMNQDMKERLQALGADPDTVRVMPMGADLTAIRAGAAGVDRIPGRLLFVGRLVEKKGLAVLLAAVRLLPATVHWSMTVVGDGPLRSELQAAARGLPVEFAGQLSRTELAARYGASEIVVVPSVPAASGDQDGLPVALLEAMGAGCPIVASDLAGINSVVLDDVSGVLVPPGDVAALAVALRDMLSDPARRARLGAGASELAEDLSVQVVGNRYRDLLNELVDRSDRGTKGQMTTSPPAQYRPTPDSPGPGGSEHPPPLGDVARSRHRQGGVVVVDGVPLPNPASTGNLLVGTIIGRWLASHADVVHGRLLDLGCGNCPYQPWYSPLADSVAAIDPAPGAGGNVRAMADRVPIRSESMDVVLCTEVLEHVDNIEASTAEMFRVLRPGGHALVTVPFLYPTHEAPYDFQRLTHIGLRSLATRHGFEILDLAAEGGPLTLVSSWFFRGLRALVDRAGGPLGSDRPLSLRRPFRWAVVTPQQLALRFRRNSSWRMTGASRLASTGYMALLRRPER